jgi:DNA invertase Pin-like site-specific DNA recombinase
MAYLSNHAIFKSRTYLPTCVCRYELIICYPAQAITKRVRAMKKAVGYIRVSTEQQVAEGVSLEAQKAKIVAWCIANDYELAQVFTDEGISGKRADNRPGLQQALAATSKGEALVVYSLSRLARSTKDTLAISERLEKAQADLVSLSEKIDTTTAAGKMVFRMLAVLSEFERDTISERTQMALAHKKAKGEVYGKVPFGYREVEGRLEAVEAEANLVAQVMKQRAAGATLQAIADHLNNQGVLTKQGGAKWYPSSVKCLLVRAA